MHCTHELVEKLTTIKAYVLKKRIKFRIVVIIKTLSVAMFVMSLFVFISFDWLCNALACRYVPQLLLAFGKFELHVRTWEFLSSSNVTRAFVVKVYMLRSIQLKFHYILWLGRHKKIEKFRWYRQKHPLGIFRSQASSVPAIANMLTIFIHKNDTKQKKTIKASLQIFYLDYII